ncbi:MAG: FliH/SctL family protein [Planctomycetota bacterium]|jgi:flagellar biosynthesis/type III secretory pathway protein FliH
MSSALTINLAKPIKSATTSGDRDYSSHPEASGIPSADIGPETGSQGREIETQKASFQQISQALQDAAGKLHNFYDGAFLEHKEQIARLAVEIARKILVKKVEEGDYEIESIVKEAIKNAPSRQDVVVHLHPDDLSQYEQLQQEGPGNGLAGVKFVPDANIGRAECVLETPKGIIESLIEQHLEQVAKALKGVK